ncbi:MAG TPA: flagellar protein export ATPase FliI [Rhodopila sp.]|jgi:flagellum-specific ATP synthase|nr:flagellar protein export ATPase FliI [Rhodopila sp.]
MRLTTADRLDAARSGLHALRPFTITGRVSGITGLALEMEGTTGHLSIGDRVWITGRDGQAIQAETIGFHDGLTRAMTFGPLDGIGPGAPVRVGGPARLAVSDQWLGRVIDPLGRPLDGKGPLLSGDISAPVRRDPPNAALRARLGPRIDLGVKALNGFVTCRQGQRLGLFAGSGVGKSTLLSMLARFTACDIAVIALVGERGRELREFIEDDLGPEGLARSVLVVATSDQPPLMRRECAYAAACVAEHFRDQGKSVLMMMDSVTRFCLALREIGLSAGEPPTTRGYPPSVFAELPRLLERAGPGLASPGLAGPGLAGGGMITGLFTVLVEGDDHNEPIADAVRGILDGHVVLDRRIAEGGRYPAVDVLRSLSRTVPGVNQPAENALAGKARAILATWQDMADLVRLGAYKSGGDPMVDEAVRLAPRIESFLSQKKDEACSIDQGFAELEAALCG